MTQQKKSILPENPPTTPVELDSTLKNEQNKEKKTLWQLKTELKLDSSFKLPENLDDWDIIQISIEELKKLRSEIESTSESEKKSELFHKFLEEKRSEIISDSQDWIERLRQWLKSARDKVAATTIMTKMAAWMENAWEAFKKWDIVEWFKLAFWAILWSLFWWLWDWIKKMFWFWDSDKKSEEKGKDKFDKVKDEVKPVLENVVWTLWLPKIFAENPAIKKKIDQALNDKDIFSTELLEKIKKDSEEWKKINFLYLRELLWWDNWKRFNKLKDTILDEEWRNTLYLQWEKDIVDAIQKRYNIKLNKEKREELVLLLKEEKWNFNFTLLLEKYMHWDIVDWMDIIWSMFWTWFNLFLFSTKLIWKWIISVSDLFLKFADSGFKMIKIVTPFWVWEYSHWEFKDKLKWMNELERWVTLWLLYRESGIFFDIISGALWISSRLAMETVSWWTGYKAAFNAQMSNFWEQIKHFEELEKSIIWNFDNETWKALNAIKWKLTVAWQIYNTALILEECEKAGNLVDAKTRISALKIEVQWIEKWISEATDFHSLRASLKNTLPELWELRLTFEGITWWPAKDFLASKFYTWKAAAFRDLESNLKSLYSYWKSRVSWWEHWYIRPFRSVKKELEVLASFNLERNLDKLMIEWTKAEQLTKLQALSKIAQDTPELFKSLFPWITGITCLSLSFATAEEWKKWTETALESMMLLTRFIWPIYLFLKAWSLRDPESWNFQLVNVAQSWIWAVLLGFDTVWLVKEWWKSKWFIDWVLNTTKYIVKPVTDIWVFASNTFKFWVNIKDVIKSKWTFKEAFTVAKWSVSWIAEKTWPVWKWILKNNKWAFIAWWIALWMAWWVYAYEKYNSFESDFEKLEKNWVLDEKWNLVEWKEHEAKKWFSDLNDSKKAKFIDLVFSTKQSFIESAWNIDFEYKDWNVTATSKNSLIWDWIFKDPRIESYLRSFWFEWKINFQQKTTS